MKLYELSNEIEKHLEAYNQVDNQEGLDAVEKQLDSLEMAFKDKAISVAHFIMNQESDILQIQTEIDRLRAKEARITAKTESLKTYLKRCMLEVNLDKVDSPTVHIGFRKSKRVEIVDSVLVPPKYWSEKVTRTISKTAIKEDWESGVGVAGTQIIEEKNLQIK